jgi:hypothetical protein
MGSPAPISQTKFVGFLAAVLLTIAIAIEAVSWLLLTAIDSRTQGGYNRVVSGYSVFASRPNFSFLTNKTDASQEDAVSDEYGFVHDEPIAITKPDGTVRIFLNGGSALFGAGQSTVYQPAKAYPKALYSYPDSIAGQLKSYLRQQRPDLRFEVVNAAIYVKKMHQSLTDYISMISRFSPDFIINMDGYNDLNVFVSGTPFADLGEDLQLYFDLGAPPRFPETLNVYQLLRGAIHRVIGNPFKTGLGVEIDEVEPAIAIPRSHYLENRTRYVSNADRFLNTLDRYMAVLRQDDVEWLFVLQPMVDREINKALTPSEAQWQRYLKTSKKAHPEHREILRYFFDDYLTGALRERIEEADYTYIDMGEQSRHLGSDFQLFTDYCHLTLEGNEFVAQKMGEFVIRNLSAVTGPSSTPRALLDVNSKIPFQR